jgi:predicted PurR-regulated permease PerM
VVLEYPTVFLPDRSKERILAVLSKVDHSYWFLLGAAAGALSIVPYVPAPFLIVTIIFKYMDESASGAVGDFLGLLIAIPVATCLKIFGEGVILPRLCQQAKDH